MIHLLAVHSQSALVTAVAAGNFVLAAWAFVAGRRGQSRLGRGFWTLLLVVLAALAVQVAAGLLLALGGARPRVPLHWLYGILVAAGALAQFGLRPGGFLRAKAMGNTPWSGEARFLALLCLTEGALVLRAFMTGAAP
jgi:hypothetical protein